METEENNVPDPNENDAPSPDESTNEDQQGGNESETIENAKVVSAVAYLGILFFVPMLTHPKSEFAMFHANQGLLLLITSVVLNTLGTIIPVIGWFVILPLANIFLLVLFIMGLVNSLQGKMKRLPLIGKFDIITLEK